jgi:energy-coupling factor transport system ATP-binding protein
VRNLTTRYGNFVVGKDLNFQVSSGGIFSIHGKSGSGKTTLLKTICGLHNDFAGEVSGTEDLAYFNIDFLYGLELTLSELLDDDALLIRLQLADLKDRTLATYSGGQKQRALVALALASPQSVVVLDEPTSALDDEMADLVIKEILQSQKTIILATHDDRLIEVSNDSISL